MNRQMVVTSSAAGTEIGSSRVYTEKVEHANLREEHEHGDEQSEIADAVDDECLLARVSIDLVVEPEADQEIRAETNALPSDEQNGIARSKHQHQHEEHEQVEIREEPRVARIVPHVADAEDVDQRTDAGDDQNHHHRQLVELERGLDLEIAGRHPAEIPLDERRLGVPRHHRLPDRDRKDEREDENARADDAYQRRPAMALYRMMVVTRRS